MKKYEIISVNNGSRGFIDFICPENTGCGNEDCEGSNLFCDNGNENPYCATPNTECTDPDCNCGIWTRILPPVE